MFLQQCILVHCLSERLNYRRSSGRRSLTQSLTQFKASLQWCYSKAIPSPILPPILDPILLYEVLSAHSLDLKAKQSLTLPKVVHYLIIFYPLCPTQLKSIQTQGRDRHTLHSWIYIPGAQQMGKYRRWHLGQDHCDGEEQKSCQGELWSDLKYH